MYGRYIKRTLDIVLSVTGLVLGAVPMLLIALAVKGSSRGAALFSQKRVGIHKTYFRIWKFRTMYADAPANTPTHQLSGAERYLTPVGKVLRKTSLDELPQLWNILKGDMSIVGPRPALWNQYELLAEREKYGANDIKPGLTGWAQVHGRDELEILHKAKLDGVYARYQKAGGLRAFVLDCYCIALTICAVWKREGVVEGRNEKGNGI